LPIPIRDADVNRTSEKIYSYAKFSIHPGKLAEFKRLAGECSRIVNEEEPGTLFYEWFMNADETECVALDCYRDIAACSSTSGISGR